MAANEAAWLIAYGIPNSRFNTYVYANVAVRLMAHDGTLGDQVILNRSTSSYPSVGSALWTGEQWVVGFSDGDAHVALLDPELAEEPVTLNLGSGSAPKVHEIGGALWAFYISAEGKFLLTYSHDSRAFTRVITMDGAFTTGISPPRLLSHFPVHREGVVWIEGNPIAVWQTENHVYAGSAEAAPRRRGVRRPMIG